MSDVGRYTLIYTRLHQHAVYRALSKDERYVTLCMLTSRQLNRVGLSIFSLPAGAEDAVLTLREYERRFRTVCDAFNWEYETQNRLFWIPSWFRFNAPQNPSHLQAVLRDLNELPDSALLDRFAANVETLPTPALQEAFRLAMTTRGLPRGGTGGPGGVDTSVDPRVAHQERTLTQQLQATTDNQERQPSHGNDKIADAFVRTFCGLYREHRQATYLVRKSKDVAIVKRLLDTYGTERLVEMARLLLTTAEPWIAQTDRGISILTTKASWLDDRAARERPATAWDAVLERLHTLLTTREFHRWWAPTRLLETAGNALVVSVPTREHEHWLRKHYSEPLAEALRQVGVQAITFRASEDKGQAAAVSV